MEQKLLKIKSKKLLECKNECLLACGIVRQTSGGLIRYTWHKKDLEAEIVKHLHFISHFATIVAYKQH